ncbi:cation-translocating P-type ATPase [Agrobacterium rosae]|uniref:Cation-translocating P-type ATPase n=1 Tax=Agrobacterium rosae TaxID=1972867 RepID=A0AAW9FEU8_9HYPH|nr:cation-translocating P-type ATPase [Agrobacterium rosae]MDX8304400.1 cation-translocating P-type ATPase [Agrobacterium rosae]
MTRPAVPHNRKSAAVDYSLQAAQAVVDDFASDAERGLTVADVMKRLVEHGPNELRAIAPISVWRRLLAQFQSGLVYLLLGAIVIALVAWLIEGRDGWPVDAIVIAIVVVANAVLGFVQEAKAADAVAALARMTAVTSSVLRDGERRRIPGAELVPGDILLLEEGDAVGADGRLLRSASLRVQEASLTGESEAVLKDATVLTAPAPLAERFCMVFKGTAVVQGTGRVLVTGTGMQTEVGAIATMLDAEKDDPTPLQKEVALIGRTLGIAVIAIAVIVVATVLLVSDINSPSDVVTVLLMGVSLAVAAVPEGLPAILSLVLALGVQRMARRNAVVKTLSSVETLGSATVICSDKTGTLTRSEMTIERIMTASGASRVTGVGYAPVGSLEVEDGGAPEGALRAESIVILSGGSLAGNAGLRQAEDGAWEIQGDPTEAAFLVAERKFGTHDRRQKRFERMGEIPFSSDRKMMSTIERDLEHGGERILIAKGAPDVLMDHCTRLRVGMDVVPFDAMQRARARADVERLSDEALRTLAVAYRPLAIDEDLQGNEALESNLIFVGTVGIIDPPREEAAVAIAQAHRAGLRVMMITGDHPRTASRIAALLGIVETGTKALTGADLDALDDAGFAAAVRTNSVYARVAPAHKLRIVDALQAEGNVVAMTGDGVNDAPALKAADIGIAMGITGTEVTKEAAKMILADDNFATIVEAVREGRGIFDNIRKFLRYLLSSNMGEVLTVFLGVIGAGVIGLRGDGQGELVLPLLATQILWINLITDSGPALAMGIDPETDDVMARPPRKADEHAIDAQMWSGVIQMGLVMAMVTLLTIDLYLPGGLIEGSQSLEQARTAGFTVLVLAQLFNCFNARSETVSAFRHLFANRWLWVAIGVSVILQIAVVNIAPLNVAFGTVPLPFEQWLVCIALGSSVLWFGEIRKWTMRRLRGQ